MPVIEKPLETAVTTGHRKQYAYIDAIRVFAICMIIVLHSIYMHFNNVSNSESRLWWLMSYVNELTRTGVPLFFMISGFLHINSDSPNRPWQFYKKRFAKLILPFLIYDAFYYCYYCIRLGNPLSISGFFTDLINCGSAMHMWFIYSILAIYLLIPFIKKAADSFSPKMMTLLFLLAIFQNTIKPLINFLLDGRATLFLTDDGFIGYIGYVILGYLLGKYELKRGAETAIYILGILSFIFFPIINGIVAIKTGAPFFNGGCTVNHYIEAAALFLLFKRFRYVRIKKPLKFLAGLCMTTFFIHEFILEQIAAKLLLLPLPPWLYYFLLCIIALPLNFAAAFVIETITRAVKKMLTRKTDGGSKRYSDAK